MVRRYTKQGTGGHARSRSRAGENRETPVNGGTQRRRVWRRYRGDYQKARRAFLVAAATAAGANAWPLVEKLIRYLWALTFFNAWLTLLKSVPYVPFL